jgi:hypothetical protein
MRPSWVGLHQICQEITVTSLSAYVSRDKERVAGWFARIDSQIFSELLTWQNAAGIRGGVAEIGVHHGKSFIALCLGLVDGQRAYAIDLFDDQQGNRDGSGRGDRAVFERHLRDFGVSQRAAVIDARGSDQVTAHDIRKGVGDVRFFSVDGGHWRAIVASDLRLAAAVLVDGGVIALDDFLRPEWPDVSAGFFEWFERGSGTIVPFAIGYNKLYLCHEPRVAELQGCLERSAFLKHFLGKHYEFCGRPVPVFQAYPLPEWGLRRRTREYLKVFHPDLYVRLRGLLGR